MQRTKYAVEFKDEAVKQVISKPCKRGWRGSRLNSGARPRREIS